MSDLMDALCAIVGFALLGLVVFVIGYCLFSLVQLASL